MDSQTSVLICAGKIGYNLRLLLIHSAASKLRPKDGVSIRQLLSIPSLPLGIFGEDTEAKPKYTLQQTLKPLVRLRSPFPRTIPSEVEGLGSVSRRVDISIT